MTALEVAPPVRPNGSDPLYRIREGQAWGYINPDGSVAIAPQFDRGGDFFEGLAFATRGELRGYINRSGHFELVLPELLFENFREASRGWAILWMASGGL